MVIIYDYNDMTSSHIHPYVLTFWHIVDDHPLFSLIATGAAPVKTAVFNVLMLEE